MFPLHLVAGFFMHQLHPCATYPLNLLPHFIHGHQFYTFELLVTGQLRHEPIDQIVIKEIILFAKPPYKAGIFGHFRLEYFLNFIFFHDILLSPTRRCLLPSLRSLDVDPAIPMSPRLAISPNSSELLPTTNRA
jgi:hypothetical protein